MPFKISKAELAEKIEEFVHVTDYNCSSEDILGIVEKLLGNCQIDTCAGFGNGHKQYVIYTGIKVK